MSFKLFVENGGGVYSEEDSAVDPSSIPTINSQLELELNDLISSPETGIQKIRRVLGAFDINVPAFYGLDPEGDEVVYDLNPETHLYVIYALNDNNMYDFYAEITDNEGLEEILSDEDDEEEIE